MVVFFPGKTFLLRSRHNLAIHDQCGRRVVVERRDSKNSRHDKLGGTQSWPGSWSRGMNGSHCKGHLHYSIGAQWLPWAGV